MKAAPAHRHIMLFSAALALVRETWLICAYFFGLGAIAGPMVILGWQANTWLRSGLWPSLHVVAVANAMNMRTPQVEAVELRPIIASVYACPLSLALFTTFIAISLCMFSVANAATRPR